MTSAKHDDRQSPNKSALVLLSGGIDSAVCLTLLREQGLKLSSLFVDYGQSSARGELSAALAVSDFYKVPINVIEVSGFRRWGTGYIKGRNAFLLHTALMAAEFSTGIIALGIHAGTSYVETVRRTDFPVHFNESRRAEHAASNKDALHGEEGDPSSHTTSQTESEKGITEEIRQDHTSERTSRLVKRFAEAYENPPLPLTMLPISIARCPAKTYAETFLDVSLAIDARGRIGARHIYRGGYKSHSFGHKGLTIFFDAKAGDGRDLSLWVKYDLQPARLLSELVQRLGFGKEEGDSIIYVLGRFRAWSMSKYSIDVEKLGDLWVSLKSDRQRSLSTRNEGLSPEG